MLHWTMALVDAEGATWTYAVADPDGQLEVGRTGPRYLGRCSPPDLHPALMSIPQASRPVQLLVVLAAGDVDEVEFTVVQLQQAHLDVVRVIGVTTVTHAVILARLGLPPETDLDTPGGRTSLVEAINAAVGGELASDQYDQAFGVAMVVAGIDGPWSLPQMFDLLPSPRPRTRSIGHQKAPRNEVVVQAHNERPDVVAEPQPAPARRRTVSPRSRRPEAQIVAYLSIQQVSEWLGVSPLTVRRLVESGDLGVVRVGRQLRVARAELDEFLRSRSVLNTQQAATIARGNFKAVRSSQDSPVEEEQWRRFADDIGLK